MRSDIGIGIELIIGIFEPNVNSTLGGDSKNETFFNHPVR